MEGPSYSSPNSSPEAEPRSSNIKKGSSFREVHDLTTKTSKYINTAPDDTTPSPFSTEYKSLDFDPKVAPLEGLFIELLTTGEDEVPELRTKEVTQKSIQVETTRQLAVCKIDDEIMDEHPSYHEEITGEEAEKRLQRCTNHGYLTRHSIKNQHYILSVCKENPAGFVFKHFPIIFNIEGCHKKYRIGQKGRVFNNLKEMLEFYENNRIDPALNKIGQCVTENDYVNKIREDNAPVGAQAQNLYQAQNLSQAENQAEAQPRTQSIVSNSTTPQRQKKCIIL